MADDRYILPVYDENGVLHEVELEDLSSGYPGIAVLDELGAPHEIESDPAAAPPSGQFPVLDESGTTHLIAFQIAAVTGIYELSTNAINAYLSQVCDDTLGLSCAFENVSFAVPDPSFGVAWAESAIEFGSHEAVAFSGRQVRYHLRGDIRLRVYSSLESGMAPLLAKAKEAVAALRSRTLDLVTTYDAYHTPLQRDGSWWTSEVRCEFRAEREYDRGVSSGAAWSGHDVEDWHAVIRTLVQDELATPEGVELAFDNVRATQPDDELWLALEILDGPVRSVELGSPIRRRVNGRFRVGIYAPMGSGVRDAMRMADTLASVVRAASQSGIRYGVPRARTLGRSGRHWLVVVDVPFSADELA